MARNDAAIPRRNQIYAQDGNWRDTGCPQVSPSCLACPLPRCKYDDPEAYYAWKANLIELENVTAVAATMQAYALKHGVSVRTAYRRYARNAGHVRAGDTAMNK